jgi:hypothetical protein
MAGRPDDFGTAEGAAEESKKQTPHGLKPVRDHKK